MRTNSLLTLDSPGLETDENPLPLGDRIFVILVANALCYGLGYVAVVGVRTLLGL
jgi:hypothetical protein